MTTKVTVEANHGWDVQVIQKSCYNYGKIDTSETIVKAGETQIFHVHSGNDIEVHEIQPEGGTGD